MRSKLSCSDRAWAESGDSLDVAPRSGSAAAIAAAIAAVDAARALSIGGVPCAATAEIGAVADASVRNVNSTNREVNTNDSPSENDNLNTNAPSGAWHRNRPGSVQWMSFVIPRCHRTRNS